MKLYNQRRRSCRFSVRGTVRRQRSRLLGLLSFSVLPAGPACGNPAASFKAGNRAYADGRYEEAVSAFLEAAAAAPESAEIQYNLGNAQYRAGSFEEALDSFEYAASMAESDALRSRCLYNLGNCVVRIGEGLRETDPQAAMYYCRQAAWFYRMALHSDSSSVNAAYNLEITQRIAAGIEEEIRKQAEEEQRQNELIAYLRQKLQEFIERQAPLIKTGDVGEEQRRLEKETRALVKVMEESGLTADLPLPDGSTAAGPLKKSHMHTRRAADAMEESDQQKALAELKAALDALPEDPDSQQDGSDEDSDEDGEYDMEYEETDEEADMYEAVDPFGDFSEYEEIRGVPPPDRTETEILAEEIRNQERRREKKAGEYKPVEKDW